MTFIYPQWLRFSFLSTKRRRPRRPRRPSISSVMQLGSVLTPSWCRWHNENPPKFTIWHNILFACAGGIFSANLYYSHPLLEVMAQDFNTNQSEVANIPTLAQAGDATGLLLILPLADFFPRRKFALLMLTSTTVFW